MSQFSTRVRETNYDDNMAEHEEPKSKNSHGLLRFDPKVQKEVTDSEFKTLKKSENANFYFLKGEKYTLYQFG